MIHETIDIDHTIRLLNEALKLDPQAVTALIEHRVPCNDQLADHPSIQCGHPPDQPTARVGLLGLLNGIFGADENGWGPIAAVFEEPDTLVRFERSFRTAKAAVEREA